MADRSQAERQAAIREALRHAQAPMPSIITARGKESIAAAAAHARGEEKPPVEEEPA